MCYNLNGGLNMQNNYQPLGSILQKYKYTCVNCGVQNEQLWVHHIDGNRKNNQENNLVPLCMRCHRAGHTGRVDLIWLLRVKQSDSISANI